MSTSRCLTLTNFIPKDKISRSTYANFLAAMSSYGLVEYFTIQKSRVCATHRHIHVDTMDIQFQRLSSAEEARADMERTRSMKDKRTGGALDINVAYSAAHSLDASSTSVLFLYGPRERILEHLTQMRDGVAVLDSAGSLHVYQTPWGNSSSETIDQVHNLTSAFLPSKEFIFGFIRCGGCALAYHILSVIQKKWAEAFGVVVLFLPGADQLQKICNQACVGLKDQKDIKEGAVVDGIVATEQKYIDIGYYHLNANKIAHVIYVCPNEQQLLLNGKRSKLQLGDRVRIRITGETIQTLKQVCEDSRLNFSRNTPNASQEVSVLPGIIVEHVVFDKQLQNVLQSSSNLQNLRNRLQNSNTRALEEETCAVNSRRTSALNGSLTTESTTNSSALLKDIIRSKLASVATVPKEHCESYRTTAIPYTLEVHNLDAVLSSMSMYSVGQVVSDCVVESYGANDMEVVLRGKNSNRNNTAEEIIRGYIQRYELEASKRSPADPWNRKYVRGEKLSVTIISRTNLNEYSVSLDLESSLMMSSKLLSAPCTNEELRIGAHLRGRILGHHKVQQFFFVDVGTATRNAFAAHMSFRSVVDVFPHYCMQKICGALLRTGTQVYVCVAQIKHNCVCQVDFVSLIQDEAEMEHISAQAVHDKKSVTDAQTASKRNREEL